MARAIAQRLAMKAHLGGFAFDSAGIDQAGVATGTPATIVFMRGKKVRMETHRSKPLTQHLIDGADIVVCMTRDIAKRAKEKAGADFAPKIVQLNESIMMSTKRIDIDPAEEDELTTTQRIYSTLLASLGRFVRMLEDPMACVEDFGAKPVPKKFKPEKKGGNSKGAHSSIDPKLRPFLANTTFDLLERSFDPPTTTYLQGELTERGFKMTILEVEEILRHDLHGYVRLDPDGVWVLEAGADKRRQDEARARRDSANNDRQQQQRSGPTTVTVKVTSKEEAIAILGLKKSSSLDDAKQKYRKLLKRYHPDKFHDDPEFASMAKEKTQRLNAAYDLLEKLED